MFWPLLSLGCVDVGSGAADSGAEIGQHRWVELSISARSICAMSNLGFVYCIGDVYSSLDGVGWSDIDATFAVQCGIRETEMQCSGDSFDYVDLEVIPFRLSMNDGGGRGCAWAESGEVECFGHDIFGEGNPPGGLRASEVSSGSYFSCAIDFGRELSCWGQLSEAPPTGRDWEELACSVADCCAIRSSGELECWGGNYEKVHDSPDGEFVRLGGGEGTFCALESSGTVRCWGNLAPDVPEGLPLLVDVDVSRRDRTVCGITLEDTVVCFGNDDFGGAGFPSAAEVTAL